MSGSPEGHSPAAVLPPPARTTRSSRRARETKRLLLNGSASSKKRAGLPGRVPVKSLPVIPGALKRVIDVLGSAAALVLLSPLLASIAILVKLTSRGPVLYSQPRCGRGGVPFRCRKFRTMIEGAHREQYHLAHRNEMKGPVFKLRNDPRVTRLGRFLRLSSLDELPQLWNVLRGEMSLVGPRPPTPREAESYTPEQARRLSVRPGLTGLWQVSGRSSIPDFHHWVELDLEYIDRWSLWLDIKILVKTLPAVLSARGAW